MYEGVDSHLIYLENLGANLLSQYGWRSLKSTWSSQWRPLPRSTVGPGCSQIDPSNSGITLGEAILNETNKIHSAR